MSGTIGIIADATGRYSQFSQCLTNLWQQVNTTIDWAIGSDRSVGRNTIVKRAQDRGSEWVLFIDDDQAFRSDLLKVLLAAEQPVVGALCLQRVAPFMPLVYAEKDDTGYWPLDLRSHGNNELIKVRACGSGGMLVRMEVFRQLGDIDWFKHTTEQSEDMFFCDRLHETDIPLYCHTGAKLGHIAPAVVFPTMDDDQWCAAVQFSYTTSVVLPIDYEYVFEEAAALR